LDLPEKVERNLCWPAGTRAKGELEQVFSPLRRGCGG